MINLSKTLFPVPLRPRTASVSPCAISRLMRFRTVCSPKDLLSDSTSIAGGKLLLFVFLLLTSLGCLSSICLVTGARLSGKKYENQADEQHVSQDDEERSQDHGICSGTLDAFGPARGAHSLEARNHPYQQPEHNSLQCWRQEIVEGYILKTVVNEE